MLYYVQYLKRGQTVSMNFEELMSKKLGGKYAQPPAQHYPAMPSPVQPPVEEVVDKVDSWFQGGGGPSTEQGSPRMGLYGAPMSLGSLHGGGLVPPNYNSDISRKRHKGMQSQKSKI